MDPNATPSPTGSQTAMMTAAPTETPMMMTTMAPSETPITVVTMPASVVVLGAEEEPPTIAEATIEPFLVTVGKDNDGLLGLCEGKCKDDDDCEGDLICLNRDSEDEVPGCGGEPKGGDDYCINP